MLLFMLRGKQARKAFADILSEGLQPSDAVSVHRVSIIDLVAQREMYSDLKLCCRPRHLARWSTQLCGLEISRR